jgi:FdhD protein
MDAAVQPVDVIRVASGVREPARDVAAAEEPLEIRLGGSQFVVIMRTPGGDRELTAGFLLSERIIRAAADIASIRHCTQDEAREYQNIINVWLTGDAAERATTLLTNRRPIIATSACGVCGRRSIDDLLRDLPKSRAAWTVTRQAIAAMPQRLRAAQSAFDETGGLHAAGLFDARGSLISIAEDVGRHNAVDKVIGEQLFLHHIPADQHVLFVSGRTSFEIVQKAVVAGIPVVAAVSAPSSLAIALARDANVTLLGFVRGDTVNVYSGAERISDAN